MMTCRVSCGGFVRGCLVAVVWWAVGCNSLMNGWLTPTELGAFSRETTLEIRDSLSIQDTPLAVMGATEPTPEDLVPSVEEYILAPGDVVNVFIFELLGQAADVGQQVQIDALGQINLPVVGWIRASGLSVRRLEIEIKEVLAEEDIIYDAQVLVRPAVQGRNTYTLFGNERLGVRLNRGPGVFPIPRPDFRVLDAVSIAGGLSEVVKEMYVFRKRSRDRSQAEALERLRAQQATENNVLHEGDIAAPPAPSSGFSDRRGGQGVALLASAGPIRDGGRGVRASSTPSQEASGDRESESGAQPGRADEPVREAETPPDSTEADEIIDLMLYSEPQAGGVEELDIDAVLPPATGSQPVEPQPVPPGQDTQLPKYIFLNGEWIEVEPGEQPEMPPIPPPRGEEPVPAIDWDEIAEADDGPRIIRIPTDELRRGDMRYNIVIRPGDVIRLESGDFGFYYVTGHIRRPGVFRFTTGAKVTLKNAIATAAGLDALGWPDRVTVYRRVGDREQMIQVNLDRIYAGLEPDFYLKADDIINVGTHPVAPFLLSLRTLTIPQTVSAFQFIYRFTRTETEFRNTNLDAPAQFPGLFP